MAYHQVSKDLRRLFEDEASVGSSYSRWVSPGSSLYIYSLNSLHPISYPVCLPYILILI